MQLAYMGRFYPVSLLDNACEYDLTRRAKFERQEFTKYSMLGNTLL